MPMMQTVQLQLIIIKNYSYRMGSIKQNFLAILVLFNLLYYQTHNACHPTCATCSVNDSITDCLSCYSTQFRTLSGTQCSCDSGYIDEADPLSNPTCLQCDYSCSTRCQSPNPLFCASCSPQSHRTLSGANTCPCDQGFFDNAAQICETCDSTCKKCITSSSHCTECHSTQNRQLDTNTNVCKCKVIGFYDDTNNICPSCSHKCYTCASTSTGCTACAGGATRTGDYPTCGCVQRKYDDGSSANCQNCHPTCLTCTNSANTDCDTCNAASYRTKNTGTGQCDCSPRYYQTDPLTQLCASCHPTCLTCTNSANTDCDTCNAASYRTKNTGTGQCDCSPRYYQTDPLTQLCTGCHYSCLTCTGPLNVQCSTCDETKFRGYSTLTKQCKCVTRYFDQGSPTQTCASCHQTCLTCSSSASTGCSTCNSESFRIKNSVSGACDCKTGYYASSSTQQLCSACHSTCLTCSGPTQTQCLSCNPLMYRSSLAANNSCPCDTGYYSNAILNLCDSCHASCKTCQNGSKCLECLYTTQQVDSITGKCECPNTTYWDSSTNMCTACNTKCLTCSTTDTNCTSCDATKFRYLSNNQCLCLTKYYDSGVPSCSVCDFRCLTCDPTDSAKCLSCNPLKRRNLVGTECKCIDKYYQSTNVELCSSCLITCQTCSSSTVCLTCNATAHFRQLSGTSCLCLDGYFAGSIAVCFKCSNKCATCSTNMTNCLTCAGTPSTRSATAPNCLCLDKYYDDGVSSQCSACHYSCKTCINASACFTCDSTKSRVMDLTNGLCKCNTRKYDDATNTQLCSSCHSTCLTCSGPLATECSSCNTSALRSISTGSCKCIERFYQTDALVELCSPCHITCLTCLSSTDTSCQSCSSTQNRQHDATTKKCNCKDKYYLSVALTCLPCHSSCATCSNSSKCDSCPSSTQANSVTGVCQCSSTLAYDVSTSSCSTCHYSCQTCSILSTNCTTCEFTNSHRVKVGSSCLCLDGYYDDSNVICIACDPTCLTCDSSGCLSCDGDKMRTKSGVACDCNDGYYQNLNGMCVKCHYSCQKCSDASSCSICDASSNRLTDPSNNNLCKCNDKFYQDSYDLVCKPCLYLCVTCQTSSTCLNTCNATKFRQFNATTVLCECKQGYFDDGSNQLCVACNYNCKTCQGSSSCSSCDYDTQHRVQSADDCICREGYYENPTPGTAVCSQCHYSCTSCTDSSTCSTCNLTAFRAIDSNSACLCITGYYDDGSSNQLCLLCHYSCYNCSEATTCDTCLGSSFRTKATLCDCPSNRYYDDGLNIQCKSCHYSCLTCTTSLSCSSCDQTNKFRVPDTQTSFCRCKDGYYDDGNSNQLCVKCSYQCVTCTNSSSCTSCDPFINFRYAPASNCTCMDGYYDDGTNPLCLSCQYTCQTCTLGTQCQTCNPLKFRQKNTTTNLCDCITGYVESVANDQTCRLCSYTCLTCSLTTVNCTTCDSTKFRTMNSLLNSCPCNQYYYDDLVNTQCRPCHYSCETCADSQTCSSCDATKHRIIDSSTDKCKCDIRYFDNGSSQMCTACDSSCLQCVNANSCSSCDSAAKRLLNTTANYDNVVSPFCVCIYKHYPQTNAQSVCLPCHYSCAACSGGNSTSCLFCTADAHRVLNASTNQCKCRNGYYDNNTSTQTCLQCHPWCTKCTNYTTTSCKACDTTYFLKIDVTTCFEICPLRFFGDTSLMICSACETDCLNCTNSTICFICATGTPLYQADCLASCPVQSTFLNVSINTCIDCPVKCITCDNLTYCTSCVTHHYLNQFVHLCFQCHQSCKDCFGPANNQCLDCQYPLYLNFSQCFTIICPYGYYIDSHQGCVLCKSLFPNSLTCNITHATLCQRLYKLQNGQCKPCLDVVGYKISNSQQDCVQICGDGKQYEFQCDDGNLADGDGCSFNCIIEKGWICTLDALNKSICTIDGPIDLVLDSVFKYGGENTIKLYLTLSPSIRLNLQFFLLTFSNLQNSNSVSWQFTQNSQNLSKIQCILRYMQSIQRKQIMISYDTSRRLLLQSQTNLVFSANLTITSYPPAIYYASQEINGLKGVKNLLFGGCIVLLFLCAINFIFVKRMHLHIIVAACIPAQFCIVYGLVLEKYTDWIKYSINGLLPTAFIGGFKIDGANQLPLSQYFGYSPQVTKNTGIPTLIILILWVFYGICIFIRRFLNIKNKKFAVFAMYYRYVLLTLQLCLLPHMSYSGINGLYNSSITVENSSSLNTCLAIVLNIYLLSLVVCLFLLTRKLEPNQLMIMQQSTKQTHSNSNQQQRSEQNRQYSDNYSQVYTNGVGNDLDNNIESAQIIGYTPERILNASNTQQKTLFKFDYDKFYKNIPAAPHQNKHSKEPHNVKANLRVGNADKEKDKIEDKNSKQQARKSSSHQINTSIFVQQEQQPTSNRNLGIGQMQPHPHSNGKPKTRVQSISEVDQPSQVVQIQFNSIRQNRTNTSGQSARSETGIMVMHSKSNDRTAINQQYKSREIGQAQNKIRQLQDQIQKRYMKEWLIFDYVQLYTTGGDKAYRIAQYNERDNQLLQAHDTQFQIQSDNRNGRMSKQKTKQIQRHSPTELNQTFNLNPKLDQAEGIILCKYKYTKYYLPITILKLYLTHVIACLGYQQPIIIYLLVSFISISTLIYYGLIRPFKLMFSNFRIILTEVCFIVLNLMLLYYAYHAKNTQYYNSSLEKAVVYLMGATLVLSILMLVIEIVCAWRFEIWNKIQPCLISMRLRGARKVLQYRKPRPKLELDLDEKPIEPVPKVKQQKQQALDAFFSRMLKKQAIQKQYRRERLMREKERDLHRKRGI